jgi:hypothetical protein
MAKAIFTGKEEKKFSFQYSFTSHTSINTIVFQFAKNFFVSYCPRDAGNGYGQYKKPKFCMEIVNELVASKNHDPSLIWH